MAMSRTAAIDAAVNLIPGYRKQRVFVDSVDKWVRGENGTISIPPGANAELRGLASRSRTSYAGLIISSMAQELYCDGFTTSEGTMDTGSVAWQAWLANRLASRQSAIYRAALAHAESYAVVLPGTIPLTGEQTAKVKPLSARKLRAVYGEDDEWPLLAGAFEDAVVSGSKGYVIDLYDEECVYHVECQLDGGKATFISSEVHDTGVTPVVRWANLLDLDGNSSGEISPLIPTLARIDQDVYDRLVTQRFSSWKVRYATGMVQPATEQERQAALLVLRQGDILANPDPNGKFGTLDASDLNQFVTAKESDVRDLAATAQVAPHHLTGQMSNLSAEALAAAEAALTRKIIERQGGFGDSDLQLMRLMAKQAGDMAGASALGSQARWRDMQSRSLAQTADALGKLATMLQVPVEMLWARIPGFTEQDVAEAKRLAGEGDAIGQLTAMLTGQTP